MAILNDPVRRGALRMAPLLAFLFLAACGGGGSSTPAVVGTGGGGGTTSPTLDSITASPLAATLLAGGTLQIAVSADYSDGTSTTLAPTSETFQSSDPSVATVDATGLVTVAADAAVGSTVIITATDAASGLMTAANASVHIKVATSVGPTPTSVVAAGVTARTNPICASLTPFYWEIGDQTSAIASASIPDASGNQILGSTKTTIASASKWLYATYVTQMRGSAAALTADDINFLNFTSGYSNMGSTGTACVGTNTINDCLTMVNSNGMAYDAQDPATIGVFKYDSGHMENHAAKFTQLGPIDQSQLGPTIAPVLGLTNLGPIDFIYFEPLLAGGVHTSADIYATVLRGILGGALAMHDALTVQPVCTRPSASCPAASSPIPEAWHFSMGHWIEDDPATNGDGAFSGPGAFGFYPWIDATVSYYGIVSRYSDQTLAQQDGEQQGYASAQCGRLIRHAWFSGVVQSAAIPSS